jgi:tetratricopeptide (TPR) repeat protein
MSSNQSGIPADDENVDRRQTTRLTMNQFGRWRLAAVLILVTIGLAFWWWQYSLQQDLKKATQAAARGSWELALTHLNRYLSYRPDDDEAQFLIAEAYIRSDDGEFKENVQGAVFHLQKINGNSKLAARARLQEGRLSLLLLKKPGTAERLITESLRLDPDSLEGNLLMWQLLDVTGRHVFADPYFWRAFELSPRSQRGILLGDWFLSEFYPEQLHADLFRQMGVAAVGQIPASVNLLVHFREAEPEAHFLHAALANYYHDLGNLAGTMDLLKESPDVTAAMTDSFFVSVLLEALIDLGEFKKADDCFKEFPPPYEGFLYWRSESMYLDYVQNDSVAAVQPLRKALATTPGKFDWGLMTRLSVCLQKNGANEEADLIQKNVDVLTREVLTVENTSLLRNLLQDLQQPSAAEKFADFYGKFGQKREVAAWNDYKHDLENH